MASQPSASIRLNANAEAWIGPRRTTPQQQQANTTPQSGSANAGRPPSPFPMFPATETPERTTGLASAQRPSLNSSLSAVPVCRYYLGGGCDKGASCPYRHELSVEAPLGGGHLVFESNVANLARGDDGEVTTPPPQTVLTSSTMVRPSASPSPPPPPYSFSSTEAPRPDNVQPMFVSRHHIYQPAMPTRNHMLDVVPPGMGYQSPQHVPRIPSPPFGPSTPNVMPPMSTTPTYSRAHARPFDAPPYALPIRGYTQQQSLIFDGVRASGLRRAHAAASSAERMQPAYHPQQHRPLGAWNHPSPPMAGMPVPPQAASGALLFDGTRDGASVHRSSAADNNSSSSGGARAAWMPRSSNVTTSASSKASSTAMRPADADDLFVGPSSTSTTGVAPVTSDSFDLPPPLSAPVIPPQGSTDEDDDERIATDPSEEDHERITQLRALLDQLA